MDQKTKEFIDSEINNNEVCLFMKGTTEAYALLLSRRDALFKLCLERKDRRDFCLETSRTRK